jgi:hypothetical protein
MATKTLASEEHRENSNEEQEEPKKAYDLEGSLAIAENHSNGKYSEPREGYKAAPSSGTV